MKITALAGGVGGAKMAHGLQQVLRAEDKLTVIVNTGDDFRHLGLLICPDLDTVIYNLADRYSIEQGWGRREETFGVLDEIKQLDGPDWFTLGDKDIAWHLLRTQMDQQGRALTEIVTEQCRRFEIRATVLPMTNAPFPTRVRTDTHGILDFQEYFVLHRCQPAITEILFGDGQHPEPAAGVVESIQTADLVLVCPSNPFVSIEPILRVEGVRDAIRSHANAVAVSPIIGGKALKGPAAKMFVEMGREPSALSVAQWYKPLLHKLVIDQIDCGFAQRIRDMGMEVLVCDTIMDSVDKRKALAIEILNFFLCRVTR